MTIRTSSLSLVTPEERNDKKRCRMCGFEKVLSEFATVGGKWKSSNCFPCNAKYSKAWRGKQDRAKIRELDLRRRLKKRYGITLEEYEARLESQGGVCASCGEPPQNGKRLDVDHCHSTKRVRGLLCGPCNRALGHVRDEIRRLECLVEYLTRLDERRSA